MKVLDPAGNVALVNRETGEDHVCILHIAREILAVASKAKDGGPLYVDKDEWDGKLARDPLDHDGDGVKGGSAPPPRETLTLKK